MSAAQSLQVTERYGLFIMEIFLKIHPDDKVAVALKPLAKGTSLTVDGAFITLSEDIPQGHKFALMPIKADEPVIKYGSPIGIAREDICAGAWIHTHNRSEERRVGKECM